MQLSSRSPRTPRLLSDSVHRQLNMYALAAGAAGVGVAALAQSAEAKIIYTPANETIGIGTTYLDLNHDGINDFKFIYTVSGLDVRPQTCGATTGNLAVYGVGSANKVFGQSAWASALPAVSYIDAKRKFLGQVMARAFAACSRSAGHQGFWAVQSGQTLEHRYLGFKFVINGEVHFGWARLNVATSLGRIQATLTGYAYETIPDKRIIAGHKKGADVITVRPATLGHLAAGASAVPAWRTEESVTPDH